MLVDEVTISVKAGDGGNGCMAFRREKFVPRGGPSGGDGGKGGNIVLESSQTHNTLIHFRFNPEHHARHAAHGEGSNCKGADADDIVLRVPVGCVIFDALTGEQLCEFTRPNERVVIAKGGRGGRGNARFATSTHQAPREWEPGKPGDAKKLRLVLKLLADVGLVGLPNIGKSSLLSRISAARPKIADYPFTTLEPSLGMVRVGEDDSFVVADIPGLIEGAHLGHGLGTRFLRHVERTRLLAHLIDSSELAGENPEHDYSVIMEELRSFEPDLSGRPMIIVASRIDVAGDSGRVERIHELADRLGLDFYALSTVTGEGIEAFKWGVAKKLREIRSAEDAAREARLAHGDDLGLANQEAAVTVLNEVAAEVPPAEREHP